MSNEEAREELKDIVMEIFKIPRVRDAVFDVLMKQMADSMVEVLIRSTCSNEVDLLCELKDKMQTLDDTKEFINDVVKGITGVELPDDYLEDAVDLSVKLQRGDYDEGSN